MHYCTVHLQYNTWLYCTLTKSASSPPRSGRIVTTPLSSLLSRDIYCLYCTVLYCTVLYCTVLYCTVLYCTVLHYTVLYCTTLYCTVLYFIDCTILNISRPHTKAGPCFCSITVFTSCFNNKLVKLKQQDGIHYQGPTPPMAFSVPNRNKKLEVGRRRRRWRRRRRIRRRKVSLLTHATTRAMGKYSLMDLVHKGERLLARSNVHVFFKTFARSTICYGKQHSPQLRGGVTKKTDKFGIVSQSQDPPPPTLGLQETEEEKMLVSKST